MSTVTHQFLLSLQEEIGLVQAYMYCYPSEGHPHLPNYNTSPFMEELYRVIFSTPTPDAEARIDYDLIQAEGILIKDGMHHRVVKDLTTRVFNQCIDTLSELIPHVAFNPQMEVLCEKHGEWDILVTVRQEFDAVQDALNRGV